MKFIKNFYQSFTVVPPVFLDGCIAVGIAFLTALATIFAGKESYEYVNPTFRFWLVLLLGATIQGMHALSKFRDGTFSRYSDAADRKANAEDAAAQLQTHPEGVVQQQTVTQKTSVVTEQTPLPLPDTKEGLPSTNGK